MKKKIGCLVTAMLLALGSGVTAHAEDYTGSGDMEVRFAGDKMESTFQSSQTRPAHYSLATALRYR